MTQAEFVPGWKLLIMQPWGWRYNQIKEGRPKQESIEQLEFYYSKLSWAHPQAWLKVAQTYAEGEEWPALKDLKASLQAINSRYVPGIEDGRKHRGEPMPDDVRDAIKNLNKTTAMTKEAT